MAAVFSNVDHESCTGVPATLTLTWEQPLVPRGDTVEGCAGSTIEVSGASNSTAL